jgi:hypothetical protein
MLTSPIQFVGHQSRFTVQWLETRVNRTSQILACDFYVDGAENAERVIGGYSFGRVVNIDHHAPAPEMMQKVSSTNLALEHREALSADEHESTVVISHTDCDSVLSSGVASGELPAHPRLGDAAIAADHTGATDTIADMLQELDNIRAESDDKTETVDEYLRYCFDLVRRYLIEGEQALDSRARNALAARELKRDYARELVERGAFTIVDGLAFAATEKKVDTEFFPDLLPDAKVILLHRRYGANRWKSNIRLGLAAPAGLSLDQLNIPAFDSAFGGRWNAGSNNRNGGTLLSPQQYAERLGVELSRLGRNSLSRASTRSTTNAPR